MMMQFVPPHRLANAAKGSAVLLSLSGRADSRALLHLLADDAARSGYALHLAHLHHGIRGTEADRDLQFCQALADRYGCPLHVQWENVPQLAKERGISPEMAGRQARYQFFARLMQQYDIPLLATAHHADDNLETILFNLSRGSGLGGICGIPETRDVESGMLLRPLLAVDRSELLAYCEQRNIPYVTDGTNVQT